MSQFFKQKSFFFFKIYKKSSIKTIQRKVMKKFQDTEQNYYWNFSIINEKKIANYKIQIVMEIIDINRRNKKHTRYKYIRYQR